MIIAITGGGGFIGSLLVDKHLKQGDQVRLLSRNTQLERKNVQYFFGDLSNSQDYCSDAASPTRVVLAAGRAHPNVSDTVEYIQIATTGDAIDFGDLSQARQMRDGACSNAHGGL